MPSQLWALGIIGVVLLGFTIWKSSTAIWKMYKEERGRVRPLHKHLALQSKLPIVVSDDIIAEAMRRTKIEALNLQPFAAYYFRLGAEWILEQSLEVK